MASALFLGCTFADGDADEVRRRGAVVLPDLPGSPVDTYRTRLYAPRELYDTPRYAASLDARAYAWSQRRSGLGATSQEEALARALHDHAIDEALTAWIAGRRTLGVMGGHALERGSVGYADAARLGHAVGSAVTVATGGGPGAMEAANLGALLSASAAAALDEALDRLAAVPSFTPSIGAWAEAAFAVVDATTDPVESLGIPTWHYGHEPPNPFATAIAKYFRNATREAVLLEVCSAGIVFLPGAGGTVQEVFQDACENYYADESSVAPMVLVGREHWTRDPARLAAAARPVPGPGDGGARAPRRHRRRGGARWPGVARSGDRRSADWAGDPYAASQRRSTPLPLALRALRLRRRAARRPRRSPGRGCRARSWGCPWPRAGGRTRARPWGRWPSTSSRAWG